MPVNLTEYLEKCRLCPRECGVNRFEKKGFCGENASVRIARAELHMWEEPPISGKNGSGTVFFSGCCLKCCFCQNYEISAQGKGFELTENQLAETFLRLQNMGAENINLVNPTHFVPQICKSLDICGDRLNIPVCYNSGGYEKISTLEMLENRVKIFLPDLKYFNGELSEKYSGARDYYNYAIKAIEKMVEIAGKPVFDENGMLKSGVIVRHLVLPNCYKDSLKLIEILSETFSKDEILLSVMSQYTPVFNACKFKEINRKTSTFEYNKVMDAVEKSGFDGYFQQKTSASSDFIPEFFDKKYY